uniref:Uncharacterized protein n=1 Tax=Rhizophora mucronata TaxID=61149 RepID=A0A2P2P164_RHIMU
MRIKDLNSNW